MDVDHAEATMMTVGTGDVTVAIETTTGLVMMDEGITVTVAMTGMITGEIAIETGTVTEPGLDAVVRLVDLELRGASGLLFQFE